MRRTSRRLALLAARAASVVLALWVVAPALPAPVQARGQSVALPAHPHAAAAARAARRHRRPFDQACNSSTLDTFVGGGSGNYVGGEDSGVLVGVNNGACDDSDAIGGGFLNVIGGFGNSYFSFVGAGYRNTIQNATANDFDSFIGAGEANSISTEHAGIGAGYGNAITGYYSFIGAGYTNTASGGVAFVGAGQNNTAAGGYAFDGAGFGNSASNYDSFVGAGYENSAAGTGSVVAGGGYQYFLKNAGAANIALGSDSFVGAGDANTASGTESVIAGGVRNATASGAAFVGAGDSNSAAGGYAFVGAGVKNTAANYDSFVGAGYGNAAAGPGSFVGAGGLDYFNGNASAPNSISATGIDAFIGAGDGNTVNALAGVVGGGFYNTVAVPAGGQKSGAAFSAIAGGYQNAIVAPSAGGVQFAFIGGGESNTVRAAGAVVTGGGNNIANGSYSAIPGGRYNVASGIGSFAAGVNAHAVNNGTFVWSDDAGGTRVLASGAPNQFLVRASGGMQFYSDAALTSGVQLAPGSGAWASLSDRDAKSAIVAVSSDSVLAHLRAVPIAEWSYRAEDPRVRHIGPMAQDFRAAFGVGEDDRHITSVDEDGVALAAIKALDAKVSRLETEVRRLRAAR